MSVSRYRLTGLGKLGAFLFVAPTPVAAFYAMPTKLDEGTIAFNKRLLDMGAKVETFTPSPTILIMLATASLIGLVCLFIGREIITTEG